MSSQNLSNYSASSILRKVNEALSAKSTTSQDDNDILELLEEADSSGAPEDKFQKAFIETSEELDSPIATSMQEKETGPQQLKTEKVIEENIQGLNKMNEKLISANTAETTSAILQELKKKSPKGKSQADQLMFESGTTVEGMVSELIKPYLSAWLDQNLPLIVKNIVEKEVKKLIPSED